MAAMGPVRFGAVQVKRVPVLVLVLVRAGPVQPVSTQVVSTRAVFPARGRCPHLALPSPRPLAHR